MLVRPYHKNLFILLTIGIWTSSREGRGFPGGSVVKNPPTYAEDMGSIPGEGNDNPFQYSCLENSMDRGAWRATVHGVAKSRTRLFTFSFSALTSFHALRCLPHVSICWNVSGCGLPFSLWFTLTGPCWLIWCVSLIRNCWPVLGSDSSLDVAVEVFLRCASH